VRFWPLRSRFRCAQEKTSNGPPRDRLSHQSFDLVLPEFCILDLVTRVAF
jgi:hypothetical protein